MADYRGLSDEDLTAKITRYETAIEGAELEGGVSVIAGEGRRMEFTRANIQSAKDTLAALYLERSRRFPDLYPRCGRALSVRIIP